MRAINASFMSVVVLMGCCCPLWRDAGGNAPEGGGGPAPQPARAEMFDSIAKSLKARNTRDLDITGIQARNRPYRDAPEEGGLLVGFDAGLENFGGRRIIKSFRPIYLTKNGERRGNWIGKDEPADAITVKARDGYVVGAISINNAIWIEGLCLRCVRLENQRLKMDDFYMSEWIGVQGGLKSIGGDGVYIVGIMGYRGATLEPCALGAIVVPEPN